MPIGEQIGLFTSPGGGGGGGGGSVDTVSAGDNSVVVTPTTGDVTIEGQSLEVTFDGSGTTKIQVLDGLNYDPATGGYVYAVLPASLIAAAFDTPAIAYIDATATIQGYAAFSPVTTLGQYATLYSADGNNNLTPFTANGLALFNGGGGLVTSPGNTPNGINAVGGMVYYGTDGTNGGIWLCIESYDPIAPTDAVWALIESGGGGGAPTLSLNYNGNGPTDCQVLDGLSYDPSVGGNIFIIIPGSLSGLGIDLPAAATIDTTSTIQLITFFFGNQILSFGPSGNEVQTVVVDLQITTQSSNPGNTPNGINATQGMIYVNPAGGIWACTVSYDPGPPTDAVWVDITALFLTVNTGPAQTGPFIPLTVTSQPLVDLEPAGGQLQPLPPLFGFSFPGTTSRSVVVDPAAVPGEICAAGDGNLWVCDTGGSAVWQITPEGVFTEVSLAAGSVPSGVCSNGGYLWITDSGRNSWWQMQLGTFNLTETSLAAGAAPTLCCVGPDGNVWAMDQSGSPGTAGVWNLTGTPGGASSTFYPVGTPGTTVLSGICAGPDGAVWATGNDDGTLWRISPSGTVTQAAVGTVPGATRLVTGSDAKLWIVRPSSLGVAVYDPIGSGGAVPPVNVTYPGTPALFDIVSGGGGDLWITDTTGFLWKQPPAPNNAGFLIPTAFPTLSTNGSQICVCQDSSFAIVQPQTGGDVWFMPFTLNISEIEITQGDVNFHGNDAGPTGPIIKDTTDGHTYRIISTAGVLSTQLVT